MDENSETYEDTEITSVRPVITSDQWMKDIHDDGENSCEDILINYLIYEGNCEAAFAFSKDSGVKIESEHNIRERNNIKCEIMNGNVDKAIKLINDISTSILIEHSKTKFMILKQRVVEQIYARIIEGTFIGSDKENEEEKEKFLSEIMYYINNNLSTIVKQDNNLTSELEDLISYIVFEGGDDIMKRREITAKYINNEIMRHNGSDHNILKTQVDLMLIDEEKLERFKDFPHFSEYLS